MDINGWKYYSNAAIPTVSICDNPDLSPIENGDIWKMNGCPLLARWTTDFDCGHSTNWWYVIKDTPFDISTIKAKHRYVIKQGINYFDCKRINPADYIDELHKVYIAAYSAWPKKYRPQFSLSDAEKMFTAFSKDKAVVCFGAFHKETQELCGFIKVQIDDSIVHFNVLRVKPEYEKQQINAALVYCLLDDFGEQLKEGSAFILDGARSIQHETAFQNYLEKYFEFRKAYCKLHISYNPKVRWLILLLFRFRKILAKFDNIGIIHKINGIMKMEEINRNK